MTAYSNENDQVAAAVLRELITLNVIAPGHVDTRSIREVTANDLKGFTQVHLFSGGGLWSVSARIARWPDSRSLWSASCPCQPWSQIGKRRGTADERDLWPDVVRLVDGASPAVLFFEQVASADGLHWLDRVFTDLEPRGYAVRAVDIPSCAVDAPTKRNRLYGCAVGGAVRARLEGQRGDGDDAAERQEQDRSTAPPDGRHGSFWSGAEWIDCHDGRRRCTRPGTRFLGHGLPGRVDLWRITGNAINPVLAAEVIAALGEAIGGDLT